MKTIVLLLAVTALVLVVLAAIVIGKRTAHGDRERPRGKRPLTPHEQKMYTRLVQALPHLIVMPQVAFSAFLTAKTMATRNTFDRKVADFVVCDPSFTVQAVIELDDSSHRGKEAQDASRDKMLADAGYRVLRYARIPDMDRVQADMGVPAHARARLAAGNKSRG